MAEESGPEAGALRRENLVKFGSTEERFYSVVHSLLLVIGAFIGAVMLLTLGISLLAAVGITQDGTPALYQALSTGVYFLGMGTVVLLYLHWQAEFDLIDLRMPTKRDAAVIVGGSIAVVALIVGIELLLEALGVELAENAAVTAGEDNPELYLYYVPVVILLNAPGEELLFRGVVQGKLRRAYGVVPGIVGAALIFGLVHFAALGGDGSQAGYIAIAALAGMLIGTLYEISGNFAVPWIVHAAWNVLVYLNLYLGATGGL